MEFILEQLPYNETRATARTPFHFQKGGSIEQMQLLFSTYGKLAPHKDNVVLIQHGLSSGCHVLDEGEDCPGWWNDMVGPSKAIDTNRFFVICINNLGSCFGSSGPVSISPQAQKPYRMSFPYVTFADIACSQQLLLKFLGIKQLAAIVGPSLGGMTALEWATLYPLQWDKLVIISAPCAAYPYNILNRAIQRQLILKDPGWQGGHYSQNPTDVLYKARMLGQMFYRGYEEMNQRFVKDMKIAQNANFTNEDFGIFNYFHNMAERFIQRFDTNAYLYALNTMDSFDVREKMLSQQKLFAAQHKQALVITVASDPLYPPDQQEDTFKLLQQANIESKLIKHSSIKGHDAFLVEAQAIGQYIAPFL